MAYNLYIPANIPVSAIIVGGTTLTTENMTLSEDGAYYIISLGNFTLRNIASTSYAFTVKVTTVRNNTLTVASEANVLAYFEAAYEDTTLMEVEKRMSTAFLKYAQSASEYLGVDTAAITELLAGKTANYYTIESGDFVNDTGVLRSAVKGVRMSLVDVPTFVFYLLPLVS